MVTIDGQLQGDYVRVVEDCCSQALNGGRRLRIFLRDVSAIDDAGRSLLRRLASQGARLHGSGVYLSHFAAGGWVRKLILIGSAVPVAVAANVIRVVMMAVGAAWFGTKWMGTSLHDTPALFSLPIGLALYLLVAWMLGLTKRPEVKGGDS